MAGGISSQHDDPRARAQDGAMFDDDALLCPDCGNELSEYSVCNCGVGQTRLPLNVAGAAGAELAPPNKHAIAAGGMRAMVARKLARAK
jgi:hypothetical protein